MGRHSRSEYNVRWFQKWLNFPAEPHFVIGEPENPYLLRWYVLPRNPYANIYLHKFMRSDDDRALHDHPWVWVSLILKGGYWEHRPEAYCRWRPAGSLAWRKPGSPHRVELARQPRSNEEPCWTLFFTGPKIREWGFHCPRGWVNWQDFTSGSPMGAQRTKGCGEFE